MEVEKKSADMEVDQIQCKLPRVSHGGRSVLVSTKQYPDEAEQNRSTPGGGADDLIGGVDRFYGWAPSSRIVRVSRASGGKDRHSKVLTSKGLRDRRVRLSVNTAIQFYDLQDRLGFDQPSKAVEWLLKAAAGSIAELPPMSSPFPDMSDEKRSSTTAGSDQFGLESAEGDGAAASNSETSKGSGGLSLSRSGVRAKARDRAKEKEIELPSHDPSFNPINQTSSFTELLSGSSINGGSAPMDYFCSGLLGLSSAAAGTRQASPLFTVAAGDPNAEALHHSFSFAQDHYGGPAGNGGGEYDLNFTISSANYSAGVNVAGFNRGTLQSNSSSFRFSPTTDGSQPNFFTGGASTAAPPGENHHQFLHGFNYGQESKAKDS